ncbi:MAG: HlyD family efflux transporter periplasmic adaptor subunit [Candidatus Kapaibacterium sp.]|nr:MAG: HlyD family efflux transporter periplasmic adaptor subunit [Candidatus Kapabacteria bacterium]
MNSPTIIEAADANDTLVAALGKPASALRWTYYIILGVLAAAVCWAYFSIVEISVHAQGVVRPVSGVHAVQSSVGGYVERLLVKENQFVQKGDTLAVLEAASIQEQIALVQSKITLLQKELSDVRALAELRPNYTFHFPTFGRERELALQERTVREQELHTAEQKRQRSSDLYLEREKQILSRIQDEEHRLAELRIERGRTILRTPANGFVTQLAMKSPNSLLPAQTSLCTISSNDGAQVEFMLPARDVGFVREGLRVRYQIDALPFQEWGAAEGLISMLAKDISLARAEQERTQLAGYSVIGTLATPHLTSLRQQKRANIQTGMTCRASVVVAEKRVLSMLWNKTVAYFVL